MLQNESGSSETEKWQTVARMPPMLRSAGSPVEALLCNNQRSVVPVPVRLSALFLLFAATAAVAAENPGSINPSCGFSGDAVIPHIITDLQHVSDLLPAIPAAEKKAQDDRMHGYFQGADIPSSQRVPGMDANLNRVSKTLRQWRYFYLDRLLNSLRSAQAAVGYVLLDTKGSREYEAAGHLVFSFGERPGGYTEPEAEKLYRATFAMATLSAAEGNLKAFLADETLRRNNTLLSVEQQNGMKSYELGIGASALSEYIRCKLASVVRARTPVDDR